MREFEQFENMRVMVEKNASGLFSAYTGAPSVGNIEGCATPEEALNMLYEKMKRAKYFVDTATTKEKKKSYAQH